ncbi:MAG: hypothetical protein NT161_03575 [Candidatus Nomurabacteria bacterium]|nr:hypothetical protein [Candidatus Nomurabacteria bacterium]
MEILANLDKDNLHHAYLIEGAQEEIVPEIFKFIESLGIKTSGNPDFCHMSFDSFKMDDARDLKSVEYEKGFGIGKKIFLISANNILLEAQNTLLKIFEEPIENTHFFIIVPNTDTLLKTLVSRFYLIKTKPELAEELKNAEKFIMMSTKNRIDFIKEMLVEGEEDGEIVSINSSRSKALKFLNALEIVLHKKFLKNSLQACFAQIFKVREFLSQPGSSAKNLMESIALIVPSF